MTSEGMTNVSHPSTGLGNASDEITESWDSVFDRIIGQSAKRAT